jgi:hypothetical protein
VLAKLKSQRFTMIYNEAPNINITLKDYNEFIKILRNNLTNEIPRLNVLKNKEVQNRATNAAKEIFAKYISEIAKTINMSELGIISLDMPFDENLSSTENSFWGVICHMAVVLNLFKPHTDIHNNTPFTLYNASSENHKILDSAGLNYHTPETVLEFHNDGGIAENRILLPKNLAIHNIYMAYKKPGNFYWVPLSLWQDKDYYVNKVGIGCEFNIEITPIVYRNEQNKAIIQSSHRQITTPIIQEVANDNVYVFINGDVKSRADGGEIDLSIIGALKASINSNPFRYVIGQKSRRSIFMNNSLGFHARDIFEEPIEGTKITRSFIRSIDLEGITLKTG